MSRYMENGVHTRSGVQHTYGRAQLACLCRCGAFARRHRPLTFNGVGMCNKCSLNNADHREVWTRLVKHYGVASAPACAGEWAEIRRCGFIHHVWNGRPLYSSYNLLCVAETDPSPTNGLISCNKIQELLDSPHGFDEALELYMYGLAIRRMR